MIRRRELLTFVAAAVTLYGKAARTLGHKERVDRALEGKDVDRTPFSFWHHFGLTTPEAHAKATLEPADARVESLQVISQQPEFYHRWPTLTRLHSGKLLGRTPEGGRRTSARSDAWNSYYQGTLPVSKVQGPLRRTP